MNNQDPQIIAITSLMGSPHWAAFESSIKERRDSWQNDTRGANVYQNHAELVHVTARVAECDWLLALFDDCRKRISGDSVSPS